MIIQKFRGNLTQYKRFSKKICKNCWCGSWTEHPGRLPKIIYYCAFGCKNEDDTFQHENITQPGNTCDMFLYPEDFLPKKVRAVRQVRCL